jgi:hypothetical protein
LEKHKPTLDEYFAGFLIALKSPSQALICPAVRSGKFAHIHSDPALSCELLKLSSSYVRSKKQKLGRKFSAIRARIGTEGELRLDNRSSTKLSRRNLSKCWLYCLVTRFDSSLLGIVK